MRVGCVICSDPYTTFGDVATIPCGHTFHTHCLLQWIEKSKSCPTCRNKATSRNVQKLFFDPIGADDSQIDPDYLQNQIDSLKFHIVEKNQILKNVNEENLTFKNQTQGLRDECIKLEKRLKERETSIAAYKDQVKHMENLVKNASKAEEEARIAKSELKLFKKIKTLLEENTSEIENTILSNSGNINSQENIKNLATISCVLKSRVNKLMEEKRKCVDEIHSLQLQYKNTKKDLSKKEDLLAQSLQEVNLLREDKEALEKEIKSLQKKISKLQDAIVSPSANVKNSVIQRLIAESPAPLELKKRSVYESCELDLTPDIVRKVPRISKQCDVSTPNTMTRRENDCSPYLQVKSASIAALELPSVSTMAPKVPLKSANNIFRDGKKSYINSLGLAKGKSWTAIPVYPSDDVGYDGLGGHHKVEHFPIPNATKILPVKKKYSSTTKQFTNKGPAQIPSKTLKDFFKDPFAE